MPGLYLLDPRAEPAADYLCEPRRAIFAICRFLRLRFQRYEFEIRRPEPPHPVWAGKAFPCRLAANAGRPCRCHRN
jgi:hypothetical protein